MYRALGREGEATFHFSFLLDGGMRFEKVCDGRVWRELKGTVSFEERGEKTRVKIAMDGRTKPLVPEFAIRGQMQEQLADVTVEGTAGGGALKVTANGIRKSRA